jgi:hypothetical protein
VPELELEPLDLRSEQQDRLASRSHLGARVVDERLAPPAEAFELVLVHGSERLLLLACHFQTALETRPVRGRELPLRQ